MRDARPVLFPSKRAPDSRHYSEYVEKIVCGAACLDVFGLASARQRKCFIRLVCRYVLKNVIEPSPAEIIGFHGQRGVLPRNIVGYPYKLGRLAVRERTEENRIYKRKDRRICADAESECQHRDSSEARRLSQCAQSVAHILHERFEEVGAVGFAALFFDLLEAAHG